MALELEALLQDENATATLILPPRYVQGKGYGGHLPRPIVGIVTGGGFAIGGGNNFAAPGAEGATSWTAGLNSFNNALTQRLNSGKTVTNKQLVSLDATMKSWQSSNDFQFQLELTFIATTSNLEITQDKISGTNDVTLPCKELLSLVYPASIGLETAGLSFNLIAPNGYAPRPFKAGTDGEDAKNRRTSQAAGVVQIAIGRWLRLRNMVCQSVQVQFSRETQKNHSPLYATVSLEFVGYRAFSIMDIENMFVSGRKTNSIEDLVIEANLVGQTNFSTDALL